MTKCPNCRSLEIIKKGKRRTKLGLRQLYYCKNCKRGFVDSKLQYKTYGPKVIVNALSYYNLGKTLLKNQILILDKEIILLHS